MQSLHLHCAAAAKGPVRTGLDHFIVKIGALARALTDAGKHGEAAVPLGHVVDELHDEDSLADAGATKEANLAAALVGRQQVDDLQGRSERLGMVWDGAVAGAGSCVWCMSERSSCASCATNLSCMALDVK